MKRGWDDGSLYVSRERCAYFIRAALVMGQVGNLIEEQRPMGRYRFRFEGRAVLLTYQVAAVVSSGGREGRVFLLFC